MLMPLEKIRFLKFEDSTDGIQVAIIDFDFAGEAAELRRMVRQAWDAVNDGMGCGVDSLGRRHERTPRCPNEGYDELLGGTYCKVSHASDLEQQMHNTQWLPPMLEYFWQNGISKEATSFLDSAGFVHEYG